MSEPSLLQRLKERKLVQWAAAYLAGAWVLVEATHLVVEQFSWPQTVGQVVTILAFFGFFIVVVIAWYHGEKGRQWVSGPELLIIALLLMISGGVLSVLGGLAESPEPTDLPASAAAEDAKPSIAVLPFQNRSGAEEDAYFTDGLHDQIITHLTKISGLSVRGLTSVLVYRDSPKNLREIGDELNARYIIVGGVQRAGGTVRINVQLIEAGTDEHIWASVYDRALSVENLFSIQTEIVEAVTDSVRAVVTPEELARIEAQPTQNLEAYDYYLRGRRHLHGRTEDGFRQAVEAFEMAIEQDSAFGPAYAGLATAYGLSPLYDYRSLPDPYLAAFRALSLADSALSLDPNLAEAYAARTYVKKFLWVPFQDVVNDAERAILLEASYADAHGWYAELFAREGRFDEALREDSVATTLDPLAPGRRVGFALDAFIGGWYDLALREADRSLALAPGLGLAQAVKTLSLLMLGHADECAPLDVGPYGGLRAMCLHSHGNVSEASAVIDSLSNAVITGNNPDPIHGLANVAASIATYYAWLGDAPESVAWFERTVALSPGTFLFWSMESGVFENVRHDTEFWSGIERLRDDLRTRAANRR